MKKKICKKYLAWMLAAAMLLTGIPVQHIQAAQAMRLSSKKITLKVGTSKIITLKNNKKKTRWKIVSGKNCIRLKNKKKSSVRIAAVKFGKAKVQAKAGKKKLQLPFMTRVIMCTFCWQTTEKALGQENCRVFLNVFTERIHQETAGRAEVVSDLPLLKKLLKTTREKSGQKVWRAKEQPCISIC